MNKINELSFEDTVASLRDTYRTLDIRALLIKEAIEWICIFLVIRNTAILPITSTMANLGIPLTSSTALVTVH